MRSAPGITHVSEVLIESIDTSGRARQHYGDIRALAASIEKLGLLHPVVITVDNRLVAGGRRIEAFKHLGRDKIPATVARNVDELHMLLLAERDENVCREAYTPEEAVHLGARIETAQAKLAKEAHAEGVKRGGVAGGRGRDSSGGSSPKPIRDESKRTTAVAAAAAGVDRRTYEKAKAVVASGDRALIDEMNRTRKVSGAYKKLVAGRHIDKVRAEQQMPGGPYGVIVVDPPSLDEKIASLPILDRAHDDCILWFWTKNRDIPRALEIVERWGFRYATMLTWAKRRYVVGSVLFDRTEHCIVAWRGNPGVDRRKKWSTLVKGDPSKHGGKPDAFYKLVEEVCAGSRLEMFPKRLRRGWAAPSTPNLVEGER